MTRRRGRTAARVAIAVAGALVLALRDPILEAWHRTRLERASGDEALALALRLQAAGAAGRRARAGPRSSYSPLRAMTSGTSAIGTASTCSASGYRLSPG